AASGPRPPERSGGRRRRGRARCACRGRGLCRPRGGRAPRPDPKKRRAVIRIENVVKRYGAVVAVDGLTFHVARGETFALIGPNGAGKTTTLKLLLGLARPDAGRIALGERGLPPHAAEARRGLGYVPQRVEFPPGRTAGEVLRFFADLRGLEASAVERALSRVGMSDLRDRSAAELSGGYAQRLSLAQALLADPELLVLDEPTASLDPEATWEFRTLVEGLHREGKTILLCSHLLSEVERVADRVLILVEGRAAALERIDVLRERQALATRRSIELGEVPPNLEDVFLSVVRSERPARSANEGAGS